MGGKKEIYRDVWSFHGAIQLICCSPGGNFRTSVYHLSLCMSRMWQGQLKSASVRYMWIL